MLARPPRWPAPTPVIAEYWPYGLMSSGGFDRFHAIVAKHYRSVIDIRASESRGSVVEIDAKRIEAMAQRYRDEAYTDLLLLG